MTRPTIMINPGHFCLAPVFTELQAGGKYDLMLMNELNRFRDAEVDQRVAFALNYMGPRVNQGIIDLNLRRYLGEHNKEFSDRVKQAIFNVIADTVPVEIYLIEVFKKCVAQVDLRLVVLWEDVMADSKTVALIARKLGIPSLHVVHGYITGHPETIGADVHDRTYTSKVAVYGQKGKEYYVRHGTPPENVVVTGNPAWDVYASMMKTFDKRPFLKDLGLDPDKGTVMYASTSARGWGSFEDGVVENRYRLMLNVVKDIQKKRPVQLLVRPHPSNNHKVEEYRSAATEMGVEGVCVLTEYKEKVLASADLVVCSLSNIAVEAMLLDKPVVNLAFQYDRSDDLFYEDRDAIVNVFDPEEVLSVVEEILANGDLKKELDERRQDSVTRYNYRNDGKATKRVVNLINEMAGEQ